MMKIEKDDFAELFVISCRGSLASAFYHTQTNPTTEQWEMLKGQREITMRDMGEISFSTCLRFDLNLSRIQCDEPEAS